LVFDLLSHAGIDFVSTFVKMFAYSFSMFHRKIFWK